MSGLFHCSLRSVTCTALLLTGSLAVAETPPTTAAPETTVPVPREDNWWAERQAHINQSVEQGPVDVLMIGDSITQGWEGEGREAWAKHLAPRHAANLGIGGDRTQHVLWRLENGNLKGVHPKVAVIMIGTNNSGADTPEDIAAGISAIVKKLRTDLPETKILLLAIFPRGADKNDRLRQVCSRTNELIAPLAEENQVIYLDLAPQFLAADGTLSKEIMPDLLHLSPAGYQIWAEGIEPHLARLTETDIIP